MAKKFKVTVKDSHGMTVNERVFATAASANDYADKKNREESPKHKATVAQYDDKD